MGLDVYLYRAAIPVDRLLELQPGFEDIGSKIWPNDRPYSEITEEEKEAIRERVKEAEDAYAEGHGVPLFDKGNYRVFGEEGIEDDSAIHPDHLFKRGYFRSSYNAGGINSVARSYGLTDLYQVFWGGEDQSDYICRPEWKTTLERAKAALAEWRAAMEANKGFFVVKQSLNPFLRGREDYPVASEKQALDLVTERSGQWDEEYKKRGAYEDMFGFFNPTGSTVHGLFCGNESGLGGEAPCVYAVCRHADGTNPLDWYIQAWEIVVETCEHVLSQDEPTRYLLHWSS